MTQPCKVWYCLSPDSEVKMIGASVIRKSTAAAGPRYAIRPWANNISLSKRSKILLDGE